KLSDEYKELLHTITGLIEILENPDVLLKIIRDEFVALKDQYGDARRTAIQTSQEDLDILDLIEPEDVVVTLSHTGYAKRQPASIYRSQRRGGKGRSATNMKEEDFIERLWIANTHDILLVFTSAGRVFWLKVYKLPDAGPNARGKPIVNLLPLEPDEKVQAVQPVREFSEDRFVFFATRNGTVKKTPLTEFAFQLQRGKIAIGLDEGDALVDVQITDGARDILLFASNGKAVRFDENSVRSMGRTATGVRGMRLAEGEQVVSLIVREGEDDVLTATERGFGKRTPLVDYPRKGRGTQGVIAIQCSERNGALIGAVQLGESHELMLISNQGTLVRTRASEIALVGRNTQGVTLIRLPADEALVGVVKVDSLGDDDAADAASVEADCAPDSLTPSE
ncbi:MAG: DNA gyrase C-terminal beta-propeller domain-containing protein, partial [Dokdonella sp.]